MKILHVTPTYFPATYWGGPIFSVLQLNKAISRVRDMQLKVLTTNAAGPSVRDNLPSASVPTIYSHNHEVYFANRKAGISVAPGLLAMLPRLVRWADVVHLTGVYSFPTFPTQALCALAGKPLVWSPHGAIQATHKWPDVRRKTAKRLWEQISRLLVRPNITALHVTSEGERAATQARLQTLQAEVIPHGVELPSQIDSAREWQPDGCLRVLFLGRLDPMKGLENLFRALITLGDLPFRMQVCGTGHKRYVAFLEELVRQTGLAERVQFVGYVDSAVKKDAFRNADVCVVPSFSESFCMVVAESLAHGVPVIASTGTPWEGLESKQCGLWIENSPDRLAEALQRIRGMDLREMGLRGRAWMESDFGWDTSARRMIALYERLLSRAKPT